MKSSLESRRRTYFRLSSEISQIKSDDFPKLLEKKKGRAGWGTNHLVRIAGTKVFVKKVPLTRLEAERAFDTGNNYRLPLFYNYGVGSAGFGAFRELATHVKTTNWVLDGEIENFPLMYHYRIVPRIEPITPIDREKHRRYVERWSGSKAVDRYIRERAKSPYELVLFLEHLPHTFYPWFKTNTHKIETVSQKMDEVLGFLQKKGIIHFDVHLYNILCDGDVPYLTDFGLALDRGFVLSADEKAFYKKHSHYDFGEFIGSMGVFLELQYRELGKSRKALFSKRLGLNEAMDLVSRQEVFLEKLDLLEELFGFDRRYFDYLEKNRDIIRLTNRFFADLHKDPRKRTVFQNAALKMYLKR
jgi:hypothetical protein